MHGEALHAEYKVPGGKLVVVDLAVSDDRISMFRLAGDFFVEPDETIPAIEAAVRGMPAASDAKTLTARIEDALPDGARQVVLDAAASAEESSFASYLSGENDEKALSTFREDGGELLEPFPEEDREAFVTAARETWEALATGAGENATQNYNTLRHQVNRKLHKRHTHPSSYSDDTHQTN